MRALLARIARKRAFESGRMTGLYRRLCNPDGMEWAAFLKARDFFHAMGEECSVQQGAVITDPKFVRLGNNVRLSTCTIFGHDGSVNMINRAYGLKLDKVGKVDLRDNVYIGHGAIVLPGVTIGPNAIVGSLSLVTKDVPPNTVVGGVPAKPLCSLDACVERLKRQNESLPWADLIQQRKGDFDSELEPKLNEARIEEFFGTPVG